MNNFLKRMLDLFVAVLSLLLLGPLLLVIALAIKLDTRGPVIFVQGRLGKDGAEYPMYKFRTMVQNAERMGTGLFSFQDDPRVTRVGNLLRQTSLDELPQIFNVLKGEMSIVGPRPPVTYELGEYASFGPALRHRFTVKPGITGLAQLDGRNDLTWDEKIVRDAAYIRTFQRYGVVYDMYLIARTAWAVLSMRNVIEKPHNQQ
jgi:lipopolysaccharide/colanic/teichoic acid biosynthesis glycosyltransferase